MPEADDPEELITLTSDFSDKETVEQDRDVAVELDRLCSEGYVKAFSSWEQLVEYLGEEPVLSRMAVIVKTKNGKVKKLIVLNTRSSGVSESSSRSERAVLPRALDCAFDIMDLLVLDGLEFSEDNFELFVLDFTDAFHQVPCHPQEQRFFTTRFAGHYYLFKRSAQGSRGAPNGWARVAALVMRLTLGLLLPEEGRAQCYVDDPIFVLRGIVAHRNKLMVLIMLVWKALGFKLAFAKGQRGRRITWIVGEFCIGAHGVSVSIKPGLIEEVSQMAQEMISGNLVATKLLRTFTGKVNTIASLIYVLRPFISQLWGALSDKVESNAPVGTIWVNQIRLALNWILLFTKDNIGSIRREFDLAAYLHVGPQWVLTLDASPWGLGGYLAKDLQLQAYFSLPITDEVAKILEIKIGSCDGQQIVEALCMLVALRMWASRWRGTRPTIRVKSDSIRALILVLDLRTSRKSNGLIAREVALDIAQGVYKPNVAEHIAGVTNVTADTLSRLDKPDFAKDIPDSLVRVDRTTLPMDKSLFRTLQLEAIM